MSKFLIYRQSDGEILRRYTGNKPAIQVRAGEDYRYADSDFDDTLYRIDITEPGSPPVMKEAIPWTINKTLVIADGVDAITVSGLVKGTVLTIDGGGMTHKMTADVDDDLISLTFTAADTYCLTLTHPLYLPARQSLEAIP